MHQGINLFKQFSQKMIGLATATGILITLSMPLTFFVLSYKEEKNQASLHVMRIEAKLEEHIKKEPRLWQFNVQKFLQIFSDNEMSEMSNIQIYDKNHSLVYEEKISDNSWIPIKIISEIKYNNQSFGFIVLTEKSDRLLRESILVLVIFCILGLLTSIFLFKIPAKIIFKAQEDIEGYFEKLNKLSYYDTLTGLRNRAYFYEYLNKRLPAVNNLSIMFLDLDRFKKVNDSYGHGVGDLLLQQVAQRINECMPENCVLCRVGGDEFTIIVEDIQDEIKLISAANRIADQFNEPFDLLGHETFITTSIGISIYPIHGEDIGSIIKNADTAMYYAKKQRENQISVYSPCMNEESAQKLKLENELRKALERDEFVLYYQPKVEIKNNQIVGMEALIRWLHKENGLIPPNKFIPFAEDSGLIIPIGLWALQEACRQNKSWQKEGFPKIPVSVNLSMKQFSTPNLVHDISEILRNTDLDPEYLEIELTESVTMENSSETLTKLKHLKHLGVKISVDDFGTGYSSLSYLNLFPLDYVKIDKSFIDMVPDHLYGSTLISSIISMSHSINLKVVAEGVEDYQKLEFLQQHHCDQIQGYIVSPPIPSKAFAEFWKENLEKVNL